MIREDLLTGIVRTAALKLSAAHPDHKAEIALRSADVTLRLRSLVAGNTETNGTAFCLEICEPLDALLTTDDEELQRSIEHVRSEAQASLLKAHFRDRRMTETDNILSVNREEAIIGVLADAVARLRIQKPKNFGPEWFKFELGQTAYDALREFAYDLESDSVQWELIAAMLPQSIRSSFDTRELGEIPEHIETREEYLAALQVLERRGITRSDLMDFANIARHIQTVQGFKAILDFIERTTKDQSEKKGS